MGKKKMFMKNTIGGVIPPVVTIPLENIISEYKFEDNVLDTVGTNDGTPTGLTYANGLVGKTGVFNGTTSDVQIPDTNELSFGNGTSDIAFSISLLIRFDSLGAPQIIEKRNNIIPSGTKEYQIAYASNDLDFRLFDNSSGGSLLRRYNITLSTSVWYSVIATYDGSGQANGVNLYLDGINVGSSSLNGSYTAMENGTSPVYIGKYFDGVANSVDGDIDCVRFWNKELTPAEINVIATDELAGIDINPQIPLQNIISQWKFEDNVLDTVGTNDGTPTALTYANGLVNRTGVFNGSANVSLTTLPIPNDEFSISFLAKTSGTSEGRIVGWSNWSGYTRIEFNSGGTLNRIGYVVNDGTGGASIVVDGYDLTGWIHIVVTAKANNSSKIYVNGVYGNGNLSLQGFVSIAGNNYIGSNRNGNASLFQGDIDCVRIWNKELSPAEITLLATDELAGIDINPPVSIPLSNIIAEYKFENNVVDTVGSNNGTATSITYEAGTVGQRGVFDGSTSFVSVPNASEFNFTEGAGVDKPFSISLLATFDTTNNSSALVNKYIGGSNAEFSLIIFGSKLNMGIFESDNWTDYISREYDFTRVVGQVYHISMTYDGSKSANGIKFYINGLEVVSTDISVGSYTGLVSNTAPILIGKRTLGTQHPHDGTLDCVRIWNKKLSSSEINLLATDELAGIDINPQIPLANIVSEYKFENNVLDTVSNNDGIATSITYASGLVGQTGVFDGSNSLVTILDSDSLSFTNGVNDLPFSFSMLAKFNDNNESILFNKIQSSNREYLVDVFSNRVDFKVFAGSSANFLYNNYAFTRAIGVWYHFTFTYDGSGMSSGIKTYVNAVVGGVQSEGGIYTKMQNTTSNLVLGKFSYLNLLPLNGYLDCVRIWNKELTQAEISLVATDELAGIDINP